MEYLILLPLRIEADPADFADAAIKGFAALANQVNNEQPITLHMVPLDGSVEARLAERVLASSFQASTTAQIV